MAINSYCTVSDIKADMPDSPLFTSTDTTIDAAITALITSASRLIDKEVGAMPGYFASSDSDTRYYDGDGSDECVIDECVSITTLSVAEGGGRASSDYTAWTATTEYYTMPYNASGMGLPIRKIIVEADGGKVNFPKSRKAVKIVGVFGYSATAPDDVKQACKIQAFRWFMRAKQGYQDASANVATGGTIFAQELDPDVKEILKHYRLENMV